MRTARAVLRGEETAADGARASLAAVVGDGVVVVVVAAVVVGVAVVVVVGRVLDRPARARPSSAEVWSSISSRGCAGTSFDWPDTTRACRNGGDDGAEGGVDAVGTGAAE